jgi:hypothetical protein
VHQQQLFDNTPANQCATWARRRESRVPFAFAAQRFSVRTGTIDRGACRFFRISFATSMETLEEGCTRLARACAALAS